VVWQVRRKGSDLIVEHRDTAWWNDCLDQPMVHESWVDGQPHICGALLRSQFDPHRQGVIERAHMRQSNITAHAS
jgi:hypothetical protein